MWLYSTVLEMWEVEPMWVSGFCGVGMREAEPIWVMGTARRFAVAWGWEDFLFFACNGGGITCIVGYWDVV